MLKKNTAQWLLYCFSACLRKGRCILRRRNALCYAFGSVRAVAGKRLIMDFAFYNSGYKMTELKRHQLIPSLLCL